MLDIETAIDVFVDSYVNVRSIVRPAESVRVGHLRVVRDAPSRGADRKEEIIVSGKHGVDRIVSASKYYRPGGGYWLSIYFSGDRDLKQIVSDVKMLGYRYVRSEPLMVRSTCDWPPANPSAAVQSVNTLEQAQFFRKVTKSRAILDCDLGAEHPAVRLHYIEDSGAMVCWARSVFVNPNGAYLAGMNTLPTHRRRGLATQVLRQVLADNCADGAKYNVLLATGAGSKLYPTVGYTQIGTLVMFNPRSGS